MREQRNEPVRERVERGVYRRKTRTGETRYEVAYSDSDRRQRWRTVATLREARLLRADLVTRVDRGERVAPSTITVAAYAEAWLKRQEARLRPSTRTLYRTYLRLHVTPRLGRRKLQSVTVDDIAHLIAEMQQGVRFVEKDGITVRTSGKPFAAWTIRGVLVVVGRMFATAVRDGTIATNPVTRLEKGERPRVDRRQFPELDRDAIGRLIAATPSRYRSLVAVSVLTGVRQGEALGLRWRDIDLKAGVIRVRLQLNRQGDLVEPKTRAAKRDIPVPPSLAKMLAAHRLASPHSDDEDFVFASETGGPLHQRNIVRRGLEKALKTTGLPHLSWHDLRHVAASALIAQGADVTYLARVFGHSSPAITLSVYAHAFARIEHDDRARAAMEAAFAEVLG